MCGPGRRLLRGSTQTVANQAAQVESCQTGIQSHPNTRGSLKTSFCGARGPFFLSLSCTEFVPNSLGTQCCVVSRLLFPLYSSCAAVPFPRPTYVLWSKILERKGQARCDLIDSGCLSRQRAAKLNRRK